MYKITHLRNAVEWHFERYEMARRVLEGTTNHLSKGRAEQIYCEEKKLLDSVMGE